MNPHMLHSMFRGGNPNCRKLEPSETRTMGAGAHPWGFNIKEGYGAGPCRRSVVGLASGSSESLLPVPD